MTNLRTTLAGLAGLLLVLTGCGGGAEAGRFYGKMLDNPYAVPAMPLTDTEGEEFSLAEDTGRPLTLVFFGYTHCPDICPAVMQNLASGLTRLSDADRDKVDVVFVTTDPKRDTEAVLRDYLDRLDPEFIGLTGTLPDIIAVGEGLAIYVNDGEELPGGGYDLGGHTTNVLGIDDADEAPVYWDKDTTSAQYAGDIQTLLEKD